MDKDNLYYLTKIVICILLCVFGVLVLLFGLEKAEAQELVRPSSQLVIGNTTYYGYDLPTRPTLYEGSSSGSIHFNLTSYYHSQYQNEYGFTELLYKRKFDEDIMTLLKNNNSNFDFDNITDIWTNNINMLSRYSSINLSRQTYFSYGFRPGISVNNDLLVLENGYNINYDSIYSYDFDVILYNNGNNVGNFLDDSLSACKISVLDNSKTTCVVNSTISVDKIVDSSKIKYYRYHVNFNANTWLFGFNQYMTEDSSQNNIYRVFGDNFFGTDIDLNNMTSEYIFSQPFNIKLWTTDTTFTCTDNCWTQEDTNNNQRIDNSSDYLFNNLSEFVDSFDYFGFTGIIQYMFDFIKGLLQDSNNSCIALNVPILSTNIQLPSSCVFWNRQDVKSYESFYHMFVLGLFSLFIGYRIYNDLLNVYNPDSKIDEEVSKL